MARSVWSSLKWGSFCFRDVRLFSAAAPVNKKPEVEAPTYVKRDHEFKVTKKAAVATLESLLGVRTFAAIDMVDKNRNLTKTASETMKSNYQLYIRHFVNSETLRKYPELLAVTNAERKLREIQKLPYNVNDVAILLLISMGNLVKLVESELAGHSKITNLATCLEMDVGEVCEYIAKKPFLCSLSTGKVETTVKLLTDYGVSLEEICNDLWVLKYNNDTIKSRLDGAKEKIETIKTWIVRAQPEILQTYTQRRSEKKSILGNSSLAEYLSDRLQCSVEMANHLIHKLPALQNKSLKKLNEIIDFLFTFGFRPQHVCRVPKILLHSVETTRKRLKQLEEKGIKIDSLHMLTKSQKQFTQFYEASLKIKNKQKNET